MSHEGSLESGFSKNNKIGGKEAKLLASAIEKGSEEEAIQKKTVNFAESVYRSKGFQLFRNGWKELPAWMQKLALINDEWNPMAPSLGLLNVMINTRMLDYDGETKAENEKKFEELQDWEQKKMEYKMMAAKFLEPAVIALDKEFHISEIARMLINAKSNVLGAVRARIDEIRTREEEVQIQQKTEHDEHEVMDGTSKNKYDVN